MLTHTTRLLAAAALALGAGTSGALADHCSGHGHTTGTVLGAVGGGAIGSAVSHGSLGGVVGCAVAGAAGRYTRQSRGIDCNHRYHHARYYYRNGHRYARY